MYAWPKFHGPSPYSFRENDLNTKKFTPPPTTTTTTPPEKQYICLACTYVSLLLRRRDKNVGEVTVVYLCTSSDHALYFYQVLWNYLKRYQSYRADTISILKITKGNNSTKNVGGVTVVNLCTLSGHALYFYQVLWNYLERYQSYRADTILYWKLQRGIISQNNTPPLFVGHKKPHFLYFYTYMCIWNFMLTWVEHEKSFITSGPGLNTYRFSRCFFKSLGHFYHRVALACS